MNRSVPVFVLGTALSGLGLSPLAAKAAEEAVLASVAHVPVIEVVGAAERLPELAGSATVLEDKELEAAHVFTVNEALRKVPGVQVRDEDGFALRPNIGIRGLNPTRSTKVLLLEDGLPLAYSPYGDNASYYHPPIERFARVEVLKGAEQILFGPQTIGGVINYITPTPPEARGGELSLVGGNRDYFNGHLSLGGDGMLLDVMRKQGAGSRDNEDIAVTDVNFKATHAFNEQHAVTFRANYYAENSDVGYTGITDAELRNFGYRYNPFENDEFEIDRYGLSVTHEYRHAANIKFLTSVYATYFGRDWWRQSSTTTDTQCDASVPGFSAARRAGLAVDVNACDSVQGRLRNYYTYGVEPRLVLNHWLLGVESEFQAGGRAHFERQDRSQVNGTAPEARRGVEVEDNEREVDAYSFFAQNRLLLGQFTLTPGVRVEYVDTARDNNLTGAGGASDLTEVVPGIGATYNPRGDLTLFAGLHKGFAPPRVEDLIVTPGGAPVATFTEVDAEESWNFEAGVRTQPHPGMTIESSYFRNEFSNQIAVGSVAGGNIPLSQGKALYEGLELGTRLESAGLADTPWNLYLNTAYTLLPTARQEDIFRRLDNGLAADGSVAGNRLPYAPRHTVTTTLGFTGVSGWDLRLEAVHVDSQFSDFANTRIAPLGGDGLRGVIKPYLVFNLAATYPLPNLPATLFVTVKNLFDRDYIVDRTRGIRVGAPLLVQGGINLRF
ncbi:MAG: TonB-dependent receptor [Gammaproteobacteria bacterium]|nr:TonB-dependent receptor [Gammaproteobacteria bacterium]